MNVVIKINGREAIPVRALPLLAGWGTMNPEKIAGALGRVTDDDRRPLFDNLHDMNAFYVENGAVHPVEDHQWREHTYRQLEALSDQIKHTEISHATGYVDWQVKALEILPEYAFVWKDEYAPIYDRTYGPQTWANLSDATREALKARSKKAPPALKFSPPIAHEHMKTLVQAALDALGRATGTAAPKADVGTTGDGPASETVAQRRDRYLALFEDEEKRGKHGALARAASREGIDRSNMKKDINKAREVRKSQTRAGEWTSQLVQDGKRKG